MQAKRSWVAVAVGLVVLGGMFPASAHAEQAFALTPGNSLLSF
jgi:hypothetical protein